MVHPRLRSIELLNMVSGQVPEKVPEGSSAPGWVPEDSTSGSGRFRGSNHLGFRLLQGSCSHVASGCSARSWCRSQVGFWKVPEASGTASTPGSGRFQCRSQVGLPCSIHVCSTGFRCMASRLGSIRKVRVQPVHHLRTHWCHESW